MDDFIRRQSVIDSIQFMEVPCDSRVTEIINALPAADAKPVRRGKWIFEHGDMMCSACEYTYSDEMLLMGREFDDAGFDFCPHCGAEMDGGTE